MVYYILSDTETTTTMRCYVVEADDEEGAFDKAHAGEYLHKSEQEVGESEYEPYEIEGEAFTTLQAAKDGIWNVEQAARAQHDFPPPWLQSVLDQVHADQAPPPEETPPHA